MPASSSISVTGGCNHDSNSIRFPFYSHSIAKQQRYDQSTTYVTTVAYLCVGCCTEA